MPLRTLAQLFQRGGQIGAGRDRGRGRGLQPFDPATELALLDGNHFSDCAQVLLCRLGVDINQTGNRLQLERGARERLQHPVVQLAGHAHALVELEFVPGEESVHLRRRLAAGAFQNSVVLGKQGGLRHRCIHLSGLSVAETPPAPLNACDHRRNGLAPSAQSRRDALFTACGIGSSYGPAVPRSRFQRAPSCRPMMISSTQFVQYILCEYSH